MANPESRIPESRIPESRIRESRSGERARAFKVCGPADAPRESPYGYGWVSIPVIEMTMGAPLTGVTVTVA
jgi:hypothetical protein